MANHLDLEEQEQLDQLKHFWNTWGTPISALLVVVMGGLAAWNGYQYWQNRQAAQASALFDAVELAARSGDQERMKQAFADLQGKYSGTMHASQGGLIVAKGFQEAGQLDAAVSALTWVGEHAKDQGHQAVGKLRLAALLADEKKLDEAFKILSGSFPVEFAGVVADRKGDILQLQGKAAEAATEYSRAYKLLDENLEYRRLVEVKLNALGVDPASITVATLQDSQGGK